MQRTVISLISVSFKTVIVLLVYVLDKTGSLLASFPVQITNHIMYHITDGDNLEKTSQATNHAAIRHQPKEM